MMNAFFQRELRGGLKAPMVYLFMFLVALLCFFAVVSDSVVIGGSIGNVHKNAPHVVTTFATIFNIFGLLFAAAFFNNAALREYNHQFNEILFSTPIKKSAYFWGRFFAATLLSTLPVAAVFIGVTVGTLVSPSMSSVFDWVPAERLGDIPWNAYLSNYFLFILPNTLFAGSLIFFLAHKFKSTVVSFVGAMIILIGYIISGTLLSDLDNEFIAALADPFGLSAYSIYSKYFTPSERNTLAPAFSGVILYNRLIWLSIAAIISYISYRSFSFQLNANSRKAKNKKKQNDSKELISSVITSVNLNFTFSSRIVQFISFYKVSFFFIIKNNVFKILAFFAFAILLTDLTSGYEYFGLKSYPLSYIIMEGVGDSLGLFAIIILVFFSGELVWRDRKNHISEVVNATPHKNLSSILGKTLALVSVLVCLELFCIMVGIFYQLALGFTDIEISLHIRDLVYSSIPYYFLYAALFIFIQVLVKNVYIGYMLAVFFATFYDFVWVIADVASNMIRLGGRPGIQYSDMNDFGPGLLARMWFNLYWMLFAVLLIYIGALFFRRTYTHKLKDRVKQALENFKGSARAGFIGFGTLFILVASFIFYNTQILNTYSTSDQREQLRLEYEQDYKKYQDYPSPKLVKIDYTVDIFPKERNADILADMIIKNESDQLLDSLFVNFGSAHYDIQIPDSKRVLYDTVNGFGIYILNSPMQINETRKVFFGTYIRTKGFSNFTPSTSIVKNGSFINNGAVPSFGYNESSELGDDNTRKKYGLKPKPRTAELDSTNKAKLMTNYLSEGLSDWVEVSTVISTSDNQIAIAPGSLKKSWTENGRNYYKYVVDKASQNFYSFISADYEIKKRKWNGIDMEVYYTAKHDYNVDIMLDAIQKSLEYYTTNFGPYYHKQARIIEFPRYSTFAQAFPGTMPYSEAFGFIINLEDEESNNVIDAVVAHEMAHQWWAHQEIPASMQGGTMLTESFSEYSSLMVMKQFKDGLSMKEFTKYDMNRYLRGRSGETKKEVPLYKVENQGYIHYGKGSVILYALQDYIGEEKVNTALKEFLNEYAYKEPPYPSSYDFLRYLEPQVPDSLKYLIDDWFKKITLYDFRLENVNATKEENGTYSIVLDMKLNKFYADTIGNEEEAVFNDWVEIGLFKDDEEKELISSKKYKLNRALNQLTIISNELPKKVGIDPKRILIERVYDDNIKSVDLQD